ncbi:hypothetical protein RIF29_04611 [Crotalaria pallida]|uniref:Uncharacterized protein n=1 Tax=Crotalaria pallida TaxID=3830 RepID=A0AAN9P9B9_CROPI
MASLRLPLAAAIVLLFLTATAAARPCRSFIMSSYTFRNPSSKTVTTITEIRSLTTAFHATGDNVNGRQYPLLTIDSSFRPRIGYPAAFHLIHRESHPRAKLGFASNYAFSSLRDRTKDILSVVLALLVGLGCGAVTASAMYLVWSAFSGHRDYSYEDFDSSDEDSEIETPKKSGYVKIPAAETPAAESPRA